MHDLPKAKPRMTQRDKWQQRPSVCAYRLWKDRLAWEVRRTGGLLEGVSWVELIFYLPKPAHALPSDRHTTKPDLDNLVKGALDALTHKDQTISRIFAEKRYDDGAGCRLELRWG